MPLLYEERRTFGALLEAALEARHLWVASLERRAATLRRALHEVGAALGPATFVVLKGLDYAHRLYPRPELRPMQDIDLLLRPGGIEDASARLTAAGGRQRSFAAFAARAPGHYERVFEWRDVTVELHRSFLQEARHTVDYESVFAACRPLSIEGQPYLRLGDSDAIAYHALSMAKDEFCCRLVRYVDLFRMLRADDGALREAAQRAVQWRSTHVLFGALTLALRLLPELRDSDVESVRGDLLSPATRLWLEQVVLPDPREPWGEANRRRLVQLWRKLWLMDDSRRRAAFLASHARAFLRGWRRAADTRE